MLKDKKWFFIVSTAVVVSLACINIFSLGSVYENIFLDLNSRIFEPIFYWSVAVCLSAFLLLFFSQATYAAWYKKVFVWFVPLGLIITFLTNPGISFGGLSRLSTASTLGTLLVITTLLFALVQRFSPKK